MIEVANSNMLSHMSKKSIRSMTVAEPDAFNRRNSLNKMIDSRDEINKSEAKGGDMVSETYKESSIPNISRNSFSKILRNTISGPRTDF